MLRKLGDDRSRLGTPDKTLFRRHSSVERYLETKELDYMSQESGLKDSKSDRYSLNVDRDSQFLDCVDFSSNPELSNSNYDIGSKEPKETDRVRDPTKNTPRVTFSESTADVKTASASSQRPSTSSPGMLDFELDVVVDIDSGRCVLHNEMDKEEEDESKIYAK